MEWAKRPPSRKSVTQILQQLNLAQLYLTYRSSKKYINRGIYNVSFAYIGIFSAEINNFCYIKKYKYILHFNISNSFDFSSVFKFLFNKYSRVHHQQNMIMWLRLYCRCGQFYKDSTRKSNFSEGCSLFKFNNLKLA